MPTAPSGSFFLELSLGVRKKADQSAQPRVQKASSDSNQKVPEIAASNRYANKQRTTKLATELGKEKSCVGLRMPHASQTTQHVPKYV